MDKILTQAIDTFSAPDGRMIKREAPHAGEYVLLSAYEALRKERDDLAAELSEYIRAELKREDPRFAEALEAGNWVGLNTASAHPPPDLVEEVEEPAVKVYTAEPERTE